MKLGAQLAIETQAAQMKAIGFSVELAPFDDEAKPAIGISNARKVVNDEDILLLIGHLNSGVAIPASEVYRQADLAMISPANTNPGITDRRLPNVNRVVGRDDVQGTAAAHFAKRHLRADTAYVVHDQTPYGKSGAEFFRTTAEQLGIRILGFEGTIEKRNFERLIREVKAASPHVLYFGGIYDKAAYFFRQAYYSGISAKLVGPDGMDSPDLVKIAGKAVVGLYYTTAVGPVSVLPMAKEFAERYRKRFGREPEPYAAEAFDATLVGLQAVRAAIDDSPARQPTRSSVSRAVRRVKAFRGITGIVEFDDKGDRRAAPYFVVEVVSERPEDWGRNRFVMHLELSPPL